MAIVRTPHFITPPETPFKSHAFHLPDEEYGRALDCLVKACTDVVIRRQSDGHIFLGKRNVEPQPDWWFVGGRMRPGETVAESAARHVKRDLGFVCDDVSRFRTVGSFCFVWQYREQEPKDHGTCDISTVLTIDLSDEEIKSFKALCAEEYSTSKWVPEIEVLDGEYAPALKQSVSDMQTQRHYLQLKQLVENGGKDQDEEIAEMARVMVRSKRNIDLE